MNKITQPLKWHGGKAYMAKHIHKLMCEHKHRVICCAGGAAEFWDMPYDGISEIINDIDFQLTNFYSVLKDKNAFEEFKRLVNLTPFSSVEFEKAKHYITHVQGWGFHWHSGQPMLDANAAANFFIKYRQSRQGLGKDFATLSKNRVRKGMNEQVSAWLNAVDGLQEAHERLRRVVILNKRVIDLIQQEDSVNTLFILDPPYLKETRTSKNVYSYEMSDTEHFALLSLLIEIKGRFLLCGYNNSMYTWFEKNFKWSRHDFAIDNKASSRKTKEIKIESIWCNYE